MINFDCYFVKREMAAEAVIGRSIEIGFSGINQNLKEIDD